MMVQNADGRHLIDLRCDIMSVKCRLHILDRYNADCLLQIDIRYGVMSTICILQSLGKYMIKYNGLECRPMTFDRYTVRL